MTFREDVAYIEKMRPDQVDIAAEDCKRVARLVDSGLPTVDGLRGKVEWAGDARDLYEQRLREAGDLLDALREGYRKVGIALDDYVAAQQAAKDLVTTGIHAEGQLGALIAPIVSSQSWVVQRSAPMKQWNDLRSSTGATDWLAELGQGGDIDAVRAQADSLWRQADDCYTRAARTEQAARTASLTMIRAARAALPDFLADSGMAAEIIRGAPGLRDEVYQAATDPNARRPGAGILGTYQVEDDPDARTYPDGVRGSLAGLAGVEPREIRASEAAILDELDLLEAKTFGDIEQEAFRVADERYPSADRNDDQNDAFRHAYWNARLTQEFGADWALRYTTAHEAIPGNQAGREAMDLHNNEIGRAVAVANPDASPEELANLVRDAVDQGRTVVIGQDGELAYSDQVRPEDTGAPTAGVLPGHPQPDRAGS
ncbi:MAG TPA: hypothetical protein VES42_02430 [Pilimelia sp.]|nr:hypothetical protein [Pilimelia sp.]